jgi:hypothetical protein
MKNLRLLASITGSLCIVTTVLFACNEEVTVTPGPDSGSETGTTEGGPNQPDSSTPDVVTTDAPVFPDAGLTLENYEEKFAATICKTLAKCCFNNADLDGGANVTGGTYDQAGCISFFKAVGFEGSSDELPATKTNLALDEAKGNECVSRLTSLTCDTPGAEYATLAKSCFAAVVGKVPALGTCTKTIECQPGNFCNPTTNRCVALRASGGSCSDFLNDAGNVDTNAERAAEACSYRGRGVDTNLHCDLVDFGLGDYRAYENWKCAANGDAGANCLTNGWCVDSLCDDNTSKCITPKRFFAQTPVGNPAGCGKFIKP